MNLPEIRILINASDLISDEIKTERETLSVQSLGIKKIDVQAENKIAGKSVVAMRGHVKQLTDARLAKTRILDDAKKLVKDYYDNHCELLISEIDRLQKLGSHFLNQEKLRVEAEEKKRQEEFQKAQQSQFNATSKVDEMMARRRVQNIIATPEPEMKKAKGQSFKQVLKYEVLDILELVKARPDLCKIEAKASAINSTCHPNLPVPGLKLWFENEAVYTNR